MYIPNCKLVGDITFEKADALIHTLCTLKKEDKEPVLAMMSPGGSVGVGFGLYDFIRGPFGGYTTTLAFGRVDSIGPLVFLAGAERIIFPHTTMFFHELGRVYERDQRLAHTDILEVAKDLEADMERYGIIVETRTNGRITKAKFREMMRSDTTLYAPALLEYGIATSICE